MASRWGPAHLVVMTKRQQQQQSIHTQITDVHLGPGCGLHFCLLPARSLTRNMQAPHQLSSGALQHSLTVISLCTCPRTMRKCVGCFSHHCRYSSHIRRPSKGASAVACTYTSGGTANASAPVHATFLVPTHHCSCYAAKIMHLHMCRGAKDVACKHTNDGSCSSSSSSISTHSTLL
jgi:hypothetical protein